MDFDAGGDNLPSKVILSLFLRSSLFHICVFGGTPPEVATSPSPRLGPPFQGGTPHALPEVPPGMSPFPVRPRCPPHASSHLCARARWRHRRKVPVRAWRYRRSRRRPNPTAAGWRADWRKELWPWEKSTPTPVLTKRSRGCSRPTRSHKSRSRRHYLAPTMLALVLDIGCSVRGSRRLYPARAVWRQGGLPRQLGAATHRSGRPWRRGRDGDLWRA